MLEIPAFVYFLHFEVWLFKLNIQKCLNIVFWSGFSDILLINSKSKVRRANWVECLIIIRYIQRVWSILPIFTWKDYYTHTHFLTPTPTTHTHTYTRQSQHTHTLFVQPTNTHTYTPKLNNQSLDRLSLINQ